MTFEHLNLIDPLLKALKQENYTTPTPIQQQAIPVILQGKDLLGCAQTGTGKTAAFALPILQTLYNKNSAAKGYKHIRTLILTPTRELAVQIDESFSTYGKYTGLKHNVIFGGVPQHSQSIALRNGTDILIATPGRLQDLMDQGIVYLDYLEQLVLDEADRMLDMGFIHSVKKIISQIPEERQTLFFSATMPPQIAQLSRTILKNPVKVEVVPQSTTAEKIEQSVYMVSKRDKQSLLVHLLEEQKIKRTIVFTRTKHGADKIVKDLKKANVKSDAIHGNKSQTARQKALNNFKDGYIKVLVATDIAARGIDIDGLTHVINYDLPNVPETYVHRIGRTGRAGTNGIALSFCDGEERAYLKDINKLTSQQIDIVPEHPFKMHVAENNNPARLEAKRNNQSNYSKFRRRQGNRTNNFSNRISA